MRELTWVEQEAAAYGTANSLRKKYLIIFRRYGGHHEAKNM